MNGLFRNLILTSVNELVRILYNPMHVPISKKDRKQWAIALKTEGKTEYRAGEKSYLSDPCHVVVIPRGCTYSWRCLERGECLLLEFDTGKVGTEIYSFSVNDISPILRLFVSIERRRLCHEEKNGGIEDMRDLYAILCLLADTQRLPYVPTDRQKTLLPAIEYINSRYGETDITNDRLAALCGMSTVYFRKLFTKVYRVSPIHYLINSRLERAKELLKSDYGSISQIAQSIGYSSVYNFSKAFKAYVGQTPSDYARSWENSGKG